MEIRNFNFGGLTVTLYRSKQHGWLTTTSELAKGVQYSERQLQRLVASKNLIHKGSVVEDPELATFLSLIPKGSPELGTKMFVSADGKRLAARKKTRHLRVVS